LSGRKTCIESINYKEVKLITDFSRKTEQNHLPNYKRVTHKSALLDLRAVDTKRLKCYYFSDNKNTKLPLIRPETRLELKATFHWSGCLVYTRISRSATAESAIVERREGDE